MNLNDFNTLQYNCLFDSKISLLDEVFFLGTWQSSFYFDLLLTTSLKATIKDPFKEDRYYIFILINQPVSKKLEKKIELHEHLIMNQCRQCIILVDINTTTSLLNDHFKTFLSIQKLLTTFYCLYQNQMQWEYRLFNSDQHPPLIRYKCKKLLDIDYESYIRFENDLHDYLNKPDLRANVEGSRSLNILSNLSQGLTDFDWEPLSSYHLSSPVAKKANNQKHYLVLLTSLFEPLERFLALSEKDSRKEIEYKMKDAFFSSFHKIAEEYNRKGVVVLWISPFPSNKEVANMCLEHLKKTRIVFKWIEQLLSPLASFPNQMALPAKNWIDQTCSSFGKIIVDKQISFEAEIYYQLGHTLVRDIVVTGLIPIKDVFVMNTNYEELVFISSPEFLNFFKSLSLKDDLLYVRCGERNGTMFKIDSHLYCLTLFKESFPFSNLEQACISTIGPQVTTFHFLPLLPHKKYKTWLQESKNISSLGLKDLEDKLSTFEADYECYKIKFSQEKTLNDRQGFFKILNMQIFLKELYNINSIHTISEEFLLSMNAISKYNDKDFKLFLTIDYEQRESQLNVFLTNIQNEIQDDDEFSLFKKYFFSTDSDDHIKMARLNIKEIKMKLLCLVSIVEKDGILNVVEDLSSKLSLLLAIHSAPLDSQFSSLILKHLEKESIYKIYLSDFILSDERPFQSPSRDSNSIIKKPQATKKVRRKHNSRSIFRTLSFSPVGENDQKGKNSQCSLESQIQSSDIPETKEKCNMNNENEKDTQGLFYQRDQQSQTSSMISKFSYNGLTGREVDVALSLSNKRKRKNMTPRKNSKNINLVIKGNRLKRLATPNRDSLKERRNGVLVQETPFNPSELLKRGSLGALTLMKNNMNSEVIETPTIENASDEDVVISETPKKIIKSKRQLFH